MSGSGKEAYVPRPESLAHKVIEYLKDQDYPASASDLCKIFGHSPSFVNCALIRAVKAGILVKSRDSDDASCYRINDGSSLYRPSDDEDRVYQRTVPALGCRPIKTRACSFVFWLGAGNEG